MHSLKDFINKSISIELKLSTLGSFQIQVLFTVFLKIKEGFHFFDFKSLLKEVIVVFNRDFLKTLAFRNTKGAGGRVAWLVSED